MFSFSFRREEFRNNLYAVIMEQQTFGGCEGPDAMYVKLISSDGHEFIVKREHALTSGTIKGEYIICFPSRGQVG